MNKCTRRFSRRVSPSIFALLWLFFDDLEIYVVPFRLRYLRVTLQFPTRKYLARYFLGKSDLSRKDSSECNKKRVKEATSRPSNIKISFVLPWDSLLFCSCPKLRNFLRKEILFTEFNRERLTHERSKYFAVQKRIIYILHICLLL